MAFIFEGRNYQFKRLPFGLVNSVAVFVKIMDQILGQETLQYTTVYVDDILITSTNWDDHCQRVERVLERLSENHITLKLEKSKLKMCIRDRISERIEHSNKELRETVDKQNEVLRQALNKKIEDASEAISQKVGKNDSERKRVYCV